MKLFKYLLPLVPVCVMASDPPWIVASCTNGAGGYITFTARHNDNCTDEWYVVTTSTPKGSLEGCYRAMDSGFGVAWSDGDSRFYPYSGLVFSDWMQKSMEHQKSHDTQS